MPQQEVTIAKWPSEPAQLTHYTDPERPPRVDMNMTMRPDGPVAVCFTLCEPICMSCDYTIGFSLFDRNFMSIRVSGDTRVEPCNDKPDQPTPTTRCVDFTTIAPDTGYRKPFDHDGAVIDIGGSTSAISMDGTTGLLVPSNGLRVKFPTPITAATVRLNTSKAKAVVEGHSADALVSSVPVPKAPGIQQVGVAGMQLTTIAITGKGAVVHEVCGRPVDSIGVMH